MSNPDGAVPNCFSQYGVSLALTPLMFVAMASVLNVGYFSVYVRVRVRGVQGVKGETTKRGRGSLLCVGQFFECFRLKLTEQPPHGVNGRLGGG